jgi:hypothetical protein
VPSAAFEEAVSLGQRPPKLTLVLELDDRRDLRKTVKPLPERVLDQLAEAPGEREKPLARQLLIAAILRISIMPEQIPLLS